MNNQFPLNEMCRGKGTKMVVFLLLGIFSIILFHKCDTHCSSGATAPSPVKNSFTVHKDIGYKTGDNLDDYEKKRCKLDLYLPGSKENFPVVVWFHGGSLKHGSKDDSITSALAKWFAQAGIGIAVVNYRLSPGVKYPAYIDDASASVAWIMKNIHKYGGNPKSIFICGHSAGGYLVYMLVMNPGYLKEYNVKSTDIAGVISISGQTFTHYTVREERGIPNPEGRPIIDEGSPCFHSRKDTPPILSLCADGDSPDRIEENRYLLALLKTKGNSGHKFKEMKDRTHWSLIMKIPEQNDPLSAEILSFIRRNKSKAIFQSKM